MGVIHIAMDDPSPFCGVALFDRVSITMRFAILDLAYRHAKPCPDR